jgi:hypothetical protein
MSDENEGWVLDTIKAKSDQLNAVDLIGGPITVTVRGVKKGADDQPVIIDIGPDHQPYKPCKSMRRVIVDAWKEKPQAWIGRSMTLHCDRTVKWAGDEVGGIRISHMSHIESARTVQLNVTRGKKGNYIVQPLNVAPTNNDVGKRIEAVKSALSNAESVEAIDTIWKRAQPLYKTLNDEQKSFIDEVRSIRLEALGASDAG